MNEDYVMIPGSGTKTIVRDVKQEIESAFLDYSMSVIVSRALPDVRDGLKPVQRPPASLPQIRRYGGCGAGCLPPPWRRLCL